MYASGNMDTHSEKPRVSLILSCVLPQCSSAPPTHTPGKLVSTVHSAWVFAKFISHLSEDMGCCSRMICPSSVKKELKDEDSV